MLISCSVSVTGHLDNDSTADGVPASDNFSQTIPTQAPGTFTREKLEKIFMPIAICGMACRLPGDICSPEDLWKFLVDGGDARSLVPATRWSAPAYYSAMKKKNTSRTQHGYFLNDNVDLGALDTAAFPMGRTELERLDPQQRLLLEVAHECIDDSGEIDWKGSNTGVYVGSFGQDWYDVLNRETLKYGAYQIMGSHDFMVSERISHELDLHGPWYRLQFHM